MKKIIEISLCILMVFCLSGCETDNKKNDSSTKSKENNATSDNTFVVNKLVNGVELGKTFNYNDLFEMTIDDFSSIDKRDEDYNDHIKFNVDQVIKLSFNFKNINITDTLYIDFSNFQIIDEDGNIAERYFFEDESGDNAKDVPTGSKASGVYYYGIKHKSTKFRIILKVGINSYNKDIFDTTFEIK